MKLIAIPYAAGTACAFQTVFSSLRPMIQAEAFEYPGHGQKTGLPLLDSIPDLAQEMLRQMFPIQEPYCLLGYSMGGHVLCELYRLLIQKHYPLPEHVFLCAIDVPNQQQGEEPDTSDQALQNELSELGGTAPEILDNSEFMEILLPIYRADIMAERKYVLPYEQLFRCEGTVIVGEDEWKEENHFSEWQRYFEKTVQFCKVNGGHFYIQEEPEILTKTIIRTLCK